MPLFSHSLRLAALAALALTSAASAALFSVDLRSGSDIYGTGAGVFGGPTTQWNVFTFLDDHSGTALTDDTGVPSAVIVSWTSSKASIGLLSTGAFAKLGGVTVKTGDVVIGGLTPGLSYDLVVYGRNDTGTSSITVSGVTLNLPGSDVSDWSTLTAGTHYVQFQPVASVGGTVTFTPNANWSAFQIQASAVPEPSEYAAVAGLAMGVFALVRRGRKASAAKL